MAETGPRKVRRIGRRAPSVTPLRDIPEKHMDRFMTQAEEEVLRLAAEHGLTQAQANHLWEQRVKPPLEFQVNQYLTQVRSHMEAHENRIGPEARKQAQAEAQESAVAWLEEQTENRKQMYERQLNEIIEQDARTEAQRNRIENIQRSADHRTINRQTAQKLRAVIERIHQQFRSIRARYSPPKRPNG